jgi:hypothetical protein
MSNNAYKLIKRINDVDHIIGTIKLEPNYIFLKGHQLIDGHTTYNCHDIDEIGLLPEVNLFTGEDFRLATLEKEEEVDLNDKSTEEVKNLSEKVGNQEEEDEDSVDKDSIIEVSSTHRFRPRLTTKDSFDLEENQKKKSKTLVLDPTKITKDDLTYLKSFIEDIEEQTTPEDQSIYTQGTNTDRLHPLDVKIQLTKSSKTPGKHYSEKILYITERVHGYIIESDNVSFKTRILFESQDHHPIVREFHFFLYNTKNPNPLVQRYAPSLKYRELFFGSTLPFSVQSKFRLQKVVVKDGPIYKTTLPLTVSVYNSTASLPNDTPDSKPGSKTDKRDLAGYNV